MHWYIFVVQLMCIPKYTEVEGGNSTNCTEKPGYWYNCLTSANQLINQLLL